MAGIFVDVGNDNGPHFGRGSPANSATESDIETTQGSLVWSDAQQRAGLYHPIEASPKMSERMLDKRGNRCHSRDRVGDAVENCLTMFLELPVCPRLGNPS